MEPEGTGERWKQRPGAQACVLQWLILMLKTLLKVTMMSRPMFLLQLTRTLSATVWRKTSTFSTSARISSVSLESGQVLCTFV